MSAVFDAVPGQEHAKRYFAEALDRGPGHAYLLTGDEGLGKRAFACELARALSPAFWGCGACAGCEALGRGGIADPKVVQREGEFIRIGQVRELIGDLGLRSFDGSRRVWLVPEADAFNAEAANAFLKSLEEPPSDVVFILVTSRLDRLARERPTIVSRCQVIEFRSLPDSVLATHLRDRHGATDDEARVCARLARGSVDRAVRLLDEDRAGGDEGGAKESLRARYLRLAAAVVFHDREAERRFVEEVSGAESAAVDEVGRTYAGRAERLRDIVPDDRDRAWRLKSLEGQEKREALRVSRLACLDALDHLASWLHDVWAVGLGAETVVWNGDRLDDLRHGSVARPELYARLLDVVGETRKDVSLNVDRSLALRAMFARFEEVWEGA